MTPYLDHLAALAARRALVRDTPTAALRCPHCGGKVCAGRYHGIGCRGGWAYWCSEPCAASGGHRLLKERCVP